MIKKYDERQYQLDAINQARYNIGLGKKRIIIMAPTGSGKTVMAAMITELANSKGKRVLYLAHRRELIFQIRDTLQDFGLQCGIIMADEPNDLAADIQIASMQTYIRRMDIDELRFNQWWHDADLIFVDECHTSISPSYLKILHAYGDKAVTIGLTATPCRSDGRGLGEYYDEIVKTVSIGDLIEKKYLVPFRYFAPYTPDLTDAPIDPKRHDYELGFLGDVMNRRHLVGNIYKNWSEICPNRKTIIFATNIAHSIAIANEFASFGVNVKHLDHKTPKEERDSALHSYQYGDLQVLVNHGILCEGTDLPVASCIVLARPSKSLGRFIQMGGRGSRTNPPDKHDCIILDHAGCINEHGFLELDREWSLDGKRQAWRDVIPREKEERMVICSACGAVMTGMERCPVCGSPMVRYGKDVKTVDGDLVEIGKKEKYTEVDKRIFYGMCESIRIKKGYAEGWTAHQYQEKFKVWPRGMKDVSPIEPDESFKGWMTHQNIKRAKGAARYGRQY